MKQIFLTALVVLGCLVSGMSACSCQVAHPQADFCNKGFVLKGKVLGVSTVENHFLYDIEVSRYYRVSPDVPMDQSQAVQQIRTSVSHELCGVNLEVGTEYLLTGGFYANHLSVNMCGWYKPFNMITAAQLRGINGAYDCSCKIGDYPNAFETDERLPEVKNRDTCAIGGAKVPVYCISKQGICVRGNRERCVWDIVRDNSC